METLFDVVFLSGQLAGLVSLAYGALLSLGHRRLSRSLVAQRDARGAGQVAFAS
jgi:hypothetical protein